MTLPVENNEDRMRMIVINREHGYAHTRLSGTCGPDVTVKDIQAKFYHPYFGGREAWVRNGHWGCVVHTD